MLWLRGNMAGVLVEKTSKINNLSYLLLGYYLSSLPTYYLSLSFEQQVLFIVAFGSFIGTLIYYFKPVERAISLYFILSKKNNVIPEQPYYEELVYTVHRSEVLLSSYLQDERTRINGAFFLAIGIFTSNKLLATVGLSDWYWWLQILTVLLIIIGLWEVYILIKRKMEPVVYFYNYYNLSKHAELMEKAIKRKDWILADKIMEKEPELSDFGAYANIYLPEEPNYGVCIVCNKIRKNSYCLECGEPVTRKCLKCKNFLVLEGDEIPPKYCRYCGEAITKKHHG
jgi:hypothetical protein